MCLILAFISFGDIVISLSPGNKAHSWSADLVKKCVFQGYERKMSEQRKKLVMWLVIDRNEGVLIKKL